MALMTLTVNKEIASTICSSGGHALGLSGRDDSLLQCVKKIDKDGYDLEFVGEVEVVNTKLLNDLLDMGICPVVSPIGTGMGEEKDIAYNVNADVAAGRIAGELPMVGGGDVQKSKSKHGQWGGAR